MMLTPFKIVYELFVFGIQALFIYGLALIIVIGLIGYRISTDFSNALGNTTNAQNSEIIQKGLDTGRQVGGMGDTVFMIVFGGSILALIITALVVDFHPAFFWLFVIISLY